MLWKGFVSWGSACQCIWIIYAKWNAIGLGGLVVPWYPAEVVGALSWEVEYVDSVHFRQKELNLVPLAPGEFLHCLGIELRRNNVPTLSSSSFVTLPFFYWGFFWVLLGQLKCSFFCSVWKQLGLVLNFRLRKRKFKQWEIVYPAWLFFLFFKCFEAICDTVDYSCPCASSSLNWVLSNTSVGQLVSLQHVESFSVSESNPSKDGIHCCFGYWTLLWLKIQGYFHIWNLFWSIIQVAVKVWHEIIKTQKDLLQFKGIQN